MSAEAPAVPSRAPLVLARGSEVGPATVRAFVDAAIADGAAMVEVSLAAAVALRADPGVAVVVPVAVAEELERAVDLGAAVRIDAPVPARDPLVALAADRGAAVHLPFGRGVPATAALDVGALDADGGDDLVGRLAALTDLAAAGRTVIATIGAAGPDDTAILAALASGRGAAILRVHEVAAAVRAATTLAAIDAIHTGSPR